MLHAHVENHTKLSRQAQLEAYDNCARLRPVFDAIAAKYDAVITPSVVDEAPVGIERTGDAVCSHLSLSPFLCPPRPHLTLPRVTAFWARQAINLLITHSLSAPSGRSSRFPA